MQRYVAFLRGMNLGGRRITNDELCGHFRDLGCGEVSAFLASGNVVFAHVKTAAKVGPHLYEGLSRRLGYEVPTFVRTVDEVRAIAGASVLVEEREVSAGKLQVAMLEAKPSADARRKALQHATDADRLEIRDRELYWLPSGKITESDLDWKPIEKVLGSMTMRTMRTVERIVAKHFPA